MVLALRSNNFCPQPQSLLLICEDAEDVDENLDPLFFLLAPTDPIGQPWDFISPKNMGKF